MQMQKSKDPQFENGKVDGQIQGVPPAQTPIELPERKPAEQVSCLWAPSRLASRRKVLQPVEGSSALTTGVDKVPLP